MVVKLYKVWNSLLSVSDDILSLEVNGSKQSVNTFQKGLPTSHEDVKLDTEVGHGYYRG